MAFLLAGISGFLAVALGAFGAHGLKQRLSADMMAVYETAVQYHFYHTLALLLVAVMLQQGVQSAALRASVWLFGLGIVVFSGSLYALAQLWWIFGAEDEQQTRVDTMAAAATTAQRLLL